MTRPGDHVDNLTGIGQRSDTTILLHLSADRSRAYGVSIPRDSVVDRPSCLDNAGKPISDAVTGTMWNEAFNVGGPACTIRQFISLTHVPVSHWIVVDFAGFKSMVDALGGVEVCLPHAVDDPIGRITLPAGTHKFSGDQALDYVRERHDLGNGSDIGRMKRQQAFIASMAHQAINANMLARPFSMLKFLDAATKSIHLDEGIGSLAKIAGLGYKFRNIGLDKIQFVTTPWEVDPSDPNRVVWAPEATDAVGRHPSRQAPAALAALRVGQCSPDPGRDQAPEERAAGAAVGRRQPGQRPVRLRLTPMDESAPDLPPPADEPVVTDETVEPDETDEPVETEWQRKRRLAAVFGDVLPDTTSDEQDPESSKQRDEAQDRWLRSQVPPHHG